MNLLKIEMPKVEKVEIFFIEAGFPANTALIGGLEYDLKKYGLKIKARIRYF